MGSAISQLVVLGFQGRIAEELWDFGKEKSLGVESSGSCL